MDSRVTEFEDALARHNGTVVRTTSESFADDLSDVVEAPAVGAPLADPLEYEGTGVETDPSVAAIEAATTGVTPCRLGIASYGSLVVESTDGGTEPISLYANHHVGVLRESDLLADMPSAIDRLGEAVRDDRTDNIIATGPSATADMGGLVYGAHGPERVTAMFVEGL